MSDRTPWRKRDWLGAAATVFALAVTFNAEYEIAIAVHIHPLVAYAVPGALDVYVLRALQVKRDVFLTVLAMVAVNAASHLVGAGVLAVSPALIVAVSAIAPLVLWRSHVLRHSASTEPVVSPVPENVPEDDGHNGGVACTCPRCVPAVPLYVPAFEEHADQAVSIVSPGMVNVPGDDDLPSIYRAWHGNENVPLLPPIPPEWNGNVEDMTSTPGRPGEPFLKYTSTDVHGPEDTGARVLSIVPPLPPEFPSVLEDGDKEFLDRARALPKLTFRALKGIGMGNDRAARIKTYLKSEHKEERP